jgi:polyhydroxyalkanoate synthesis regulator phasin
MVFEAFRSYLQLVSGLSEVTRQRARAAAKSLVAQAGMTPEQMGDLVEEIVHTSKANRDALMNLVQQEVEQGLGRLGLATAEDIARMRERLVHLEGALADAVTRVSRSRPHPWAGATSSEPAEGEPPVATAPRPVRKPAARKTAAATATAKTAGTKATAKKATAKEATAKKATAQKTTAKKTATKSATKTAAKAAAKKSVTTPSRRTPANKATTQRPAAEPAASPSGPDAPTGSAQAAEYPGPTA